MIRSAIPRTGPVIVCACALTTGLAATHPLPTRAGSSATASCARAARTRRARAAARVDPPRPADRRRRPLGPATRRSGRRYERDEALRRDGVVSRPRARDARAPATAASRRTAVGPSRGRRSTRTGGQRRRPRRHPRCMRRSTPNRITDKPIVRRRPWPVEDSGYDCSGRSPPSPRCRAARRSRDTTRFMSYGRRGRGQWIAATRTAATPTS